MRLAEFLGDLDNLFRLCFRPCSGAGFVGLAIVRNQFQEQWQIISLSFSTNPFNKRIFTIVDNIRFVRVNVQ